ncbi:MAG TPA: FAD-binding oxidoreductase [Candidatus Limnocylindria bacterium]|nr:FAD-binding oxidoreductase [Candidatus Limnocylindria bacterium]
MTDALVDGLAGIVGDAHCLTDPDLRASHETDWTGRWRGHARAVVRPADRDQVAAVLRACAADGVAVVPQGGNTGLVGGAVPPDGAVVLVTTRLREIGPLDALGGQVTVGAGATLAAVQAAVRGSGWEVGIDLAARDSATIGGMAATNAGGAQAVRHGPMRARVAGLEAVLADGTTIARMAGLAKDNTGYDLRGLLVGSEGTLGVITAVRLQLVPAAGRRSAALVPLGSTAEALEVVSRARRALPGLLAAELFHEPGLRLVLDHAGLAHPFGGREVGAYLLLETSDAADVLGGLLDAHDDALLADDDAGRARLWAYRERHTESINAAGIPHKLDVSLPLTAIPGFEKRCVALVADRARAILYGHLGDGNLHVNLLGPAPDDEVLDEAVLRLAIELGGSISAEHGIGRAKVALLPLDRASGDLAAMRAIKSALDPAGILNPGVLFDELYGSLDMEESADDFIERIRGR